MKRKISCVLLLISLLFSLFSCAKEEERVSKIDQITVAETGYNLCYSILKKGNGALYAEVYACSLTATTAEVILPSSVIYGDAVAEVKGIAPAAFYKADIDKVTIPDTVTYIDRYAFSGSGLSEITLPASVESIGEKAFFDCNNLQNVYLLANTPPDLGSGVFFSQNNKVSKQLVLWVAPSAFEKYTDGAAYPAWKEYLSSLAKTSEGD